MKMRLAQAFLRRWHKMLGLKPQPPTWYAERLAEELQEAAEAKTRIEKLSETSDVYFSIIRAKYDGFPVGKLRPFVASRDVPIYAYMLGKFTLRWGFYRVAAVVCKGWKGMEVREAVNPRKESKLREVVMRHEIDPDEFVRVGSRLRWMWPLLP